jgi:hypothetical protein
MGQNKQNTVWESTEGNGPNQPTPWSTVLLQTLTVPQLVPAQKNPPHFMEPISSLHCPHKPIACPGSELENQLRAFPSYFLRSHCNATLPSTLTSSKLSLSLKFSKENPLCTSLFTHAQQFLY